MGQRSSAAKEARVPAQSSSQERTSQSGLRATASASSESLCVESCDGADAHSPQTYTSEIQSRYSEHSDRSHKKRYPSEAEGANRPRKQSNASNAPVRRDSNSSLGSSLHAFQALQTEIGPKAGLFLQSDPNFRGIGESKQRRLAGALTQRFFEGGSVILRGGVAVETLFIVTSGKVQAELKGCAAREEGQGAVLGCVGLLYGTSQRESYIAKGPVWCLSLERQALQELPGPIVDIFRRCAVKAMLRALPVNHFKSLSRMQLHRVIGLAEDAFFEPAELIAAEGDAPQLLLIVDGEACVLPAELRPEEGGNGLVQNVPSVLEQKLCHGDAYGEDELSEGIPMSRNVVALTRVRVHRFMFDAVVQALGDSLKDVKWQAEVKRVLSDIFLFRNLRDDLIERTVRNLEQHSFPAGEVIVSQGDPAVHFFLIRSGRISVQIDDRVVRTLGRWDYFGERGLLLRERRSATCQALDDCECLVLDADVFFEIVGMFRKELERRIYLQDLDIKIDNLWCHAVIGRGAFGVVRLVHHKSDQRKQYALKCVKKLHVVRQGQERSMLMERDVNAQCYHPCIVQFIKTFQDAHNVYFLTEFLGGGDLFSAIRQIGNLSKEQSQFFAGSVVLGIEYLHARTIMYRDLKPENVLLDFRGSAKLVDFGCCKQVVTACTLIGTPDYIAPEVIRGQGYTSAIDWWSLGVMMYEFIVGPLPFADDQDRTDEVFRAILEAPLRIPESVTDESSVSILRGLLDRRVARRLGSSIRDAKEIQEHPYFKNLRWDALAGGFLEPPWKPPTEDMKRSWEVVDNDLLQFVSKGEIKQKKGMEWAQSF